MTPTPVELREMQPADLSAVRAIYNHYVLTSTCTFETEPRDDAAWDVWLAEHRADHPAVVALRPDEVVGWGCLSRWNNRCAYRFAVEDTVYVRPDRHGRGIGRAILTRLVTLGRQGGHRTIIAQIADRQPASEALHASLGFRQAGRLVSVGFKFNRWIDVAIWQLTLDEHHTG